jgi:group I intron endonuclease
MDKICGIYKITSPNKKIYIGSSKNIKNRIYSYKKMHHKGQIHLYRSMLKYGFDNHKFEIIMECAFEDLFYFERCFQEIYNSVKFGLNCEYVNTTEKPKLRSDEICKKISKSKMGYKHSEETKLKMSNYAKNRPQEVRDKIGAKHKGKIISDETKLKMRLAELGKKHSEETKLKMRLNNKKTMLGKPSPLRKAVLQFSLEGQFLNKFESLANAELETNTARSSIRRCCNKKLKTANKFIWIWADDINNFSN